MPAKRTDEDIELANALRGTGRRFQAGKPIDIGAISRLIEARRPQQPQMCATLTDLIQAAQDDNSRGDRVGLRAGE